MENEKVENNKNNINHIIIQSPDIKLYNNNEMIYGILKFSQTYNILTNMNKTKDLNDWEIINVDNDYEVDQSWIILNE